MRPLFHAVVIAMAIAMPAISFAQSSNQPLSRAQVRTQLIELEQAGYHPSMNDNQYPVDIQAAEARVAAKKTAESAYGPGVDGSSQSGK